MKKKTVVLLLAVFAAANLGAQQFQDETALPNVVPAADITRSLDATVSALQAAISALENSVSEKVALEKDNERLTAEITAAKEQLESLKAELAQAKEQAASPRAAVKAPRQHITNASAAVLNCALPFGIGSYMQGDNLGGAFATTIDTLAALAAVLYAVDTIMYKSYSNDGRYVDDDGDPATADVIQFPTRQGLFSKGDDRAIASFVGAGAIAFAVLGRVFGISRALSRTEDFQFVPVVDTEGNVGAGVRINL